MGKNIIVQRRGRGSSTYRVNKKSFRYKLQFPKILAGEGKVIKLFNSPAHSAPLAKISYKDGTFFMPAFKGMIEGQTIKFDNKEVIEGNVMKLENIPLKTQIYNIESKPGDGGIFIKTAGSSATINKSIDGNIFVIMLIGSDLYYFSNKIG